MYTPGPWTLTEYNVNQYELQHERDAIGPLHVAFLRMTGLSSDDANARLIAAAPELLVALKTVVGFCESHGIGVEHIHAAIAKAEGL